MAQNNDDERSNPKDENSRMNVSMRKGIRGWFDVDGMTISFFGSNWTGREIVRVTDEHGERVVSDKRSFRFSTSHEFSAAGNEYCVVLNIGVGKAEIHLYRNGTLIDSDAYVDSATQVHPETGKIDWRATIKKQFVPILGLFLGGAVFGYAAVSVIQRMMQS